jgi:hypothetical protein
VKDPAPTFGALGSLIKWMGLSGVGFGLFGSVVAVWSVVEADVIGLRRDLLATQVGKAALALLLGCMFFVLAGAGLVLISRPLLRVRTDDERIPRWPRWLGRALFGYSAGCLALAVILMLELAGRASGGVLAGLVVYCVMVGGGLLVASWGMKRFVEAP